MSASCGGTESSTERRSTASSDAASGKSTSVPPSLSGYLEFVPAMGYVQLSRMVALES